MLGNDQSRRSTDQPQKEPGSRNRYDLNSLEAWNCGQNPGPQFLQNHVRYYRPRAGVKPLIPKITFGYASKNGGDSSGRGFRNGGEPRAIQTSPGRARSSFYSKRSVRPQRNKETNVLPNTSRYGFYRYYGLPGPGAKTSKGYRPGP